MYLQLNCNIKVSHKDTDEIKILSGKDNIFTFIKHWPYKSQANMHLRVSYPGGVMAGKCHMQVANCKSQVIYSPKHLQEKGNLFLIRSLNNLRNRKELTLRLTSIISKNKQIDSSRMILFYQYNDNSRT